jgi:hypothetical protein
MKDWEIIADNLSKASFSWGCVSAIDLEARTIWIVDAHGYGKRFVVGADEKLTLYWLKRLRPALFRQETGSSPARPKLKQHRAAAIRSTLLRSVCKC